MKIINIQLGRDSSYTQMTASLLSSRWKAVVSSESTKGSAYPDEREVPVEIAERMAQAAFDALTASGWLTPTFAPETIAPVAEPEPEAPAERPTSEDMPLESDNVPI